MRNTIFFKLKYFNILNDYYFPNINLQYKHCSSVFEYIIKTVL